MDYSGGPNVAIKVYSGEGGRKDIKAKTDVTGRQMRRSLTSLVAFKMEEHYRMQWRLSPKAGNDKERVSPLDPPKINKVQVALNFRPVRLLTHRTLRSVKLVVTCDSSNRELIQPPKFSQS